MTSLRKHLIKINVTFLRCILSFHMILIGTKAM